MLASLAYNISRYYSIWVNDSAGGRAPLWTIISGGVCAQAGSVRAQAGYKSVREAGPGSPRGPREAGPDPSYR